MIGVATVTFDAEGARIFRATRPYEPENRQGSRRVSRTATLDGGVAISDMGYSDGDRDVSIRENKASSDAVAFARRMTEVYQTVTITTDDGAYLAAPRSYRVSGGELIMEMLIIEKISE
jgi:hypothetical protein